MNGDPKTPDTNGVIQRPRRYEVDEGIARLLLVSQVAHFGGAPLHDLVPHRKFHHGPLFVVSELAKEISRWYDQWYRGTRLEQGTVYATVTNDFLRYMLIRQSEDPGLQLAVMGYPCESSLTMGLPRQFAGPPEGWESTVHVYRNGSPYLCESFLMRSFRRMGLFFRDPERRLSRYMECDLVDGWVPFSEEDLNYIRQNTIEVAIQFDRSYYLFWQEDPVVVP